MRDVIPVAVEQFDEGGDVVEVVVVAAGLRVGLHQLVEQRRAGAVRETDPSRQCVPAGVQSGLGLLSGHGSWVLDVRCRA